MKFFFILLALFPYFLFAQAPQKCAKEDVLADLQNLRTVLEQAHYDMYAYTTKSTFDSVYISKKNSLAEDSLTLVEATNVFKEVVASLNIGHTNIAFPVSSYIAYAQNGGTLFPLEIAIEDGKAYIRKNWSNNDDIKVGSELVQLNGESLTNIFDQIYPKISAESPYFKQAKLEVISFPRLYWMVYGPKNKFEVVVQLKGETTRHHLEAIPVIDGYEKKREEVLNAQQQLKFYAQTAYLNPGHFSGDEINYQQFIDSAFVEINKKNSQNLIIDLRNNSGGNDSFSDYLVSYIATKPFVWNSHFTLKSSAVLKEDTRATKDTTEAYWKAVLAHKNGEIYPFHFEKVDPKPIDKRFHGKVYVLINRQSHSQSAVTAAQIQDYQFGTLVGEETGEFQSIYASIFPYVLPKTGITLNIAKGYIVRVNGSEELHGVIPDIQIHDYLRDDEDEILQGLLKRLKSN